MDDTESQLRDFLVCPTCGLKEGRISTYSDEVDFRGLVLELEDLATYECGSCYALWTDTELERLNLIKRREAYAAKRDLVRKEQGLLESKDIAEIRSRLALNQREASELFGGGANSFNKYESGEVLQSVPMDRMLRLAKQYGSDLVRSLREIVARKGNDVSDATRGLTVVEPVNTTASRSYVASAKEHVTRVTSIVERAISNFENFDRDRKEVIYLGTRTRSSTFAIETWSKHDSMSPHDEVVLSPIALAGAISQLHLVHKPQLTRQ